MNLLGILVVSIIFMVVGSLWYSPLLFAKPWMKYLGMKSMKVDQREMAPQYLMMFVAALIMSFVLERFIALLGVTGLFNGLLVGFWAWLGFIATYALSGVAFEKRLWGLYWINVGYYLVALLIAGAILGMWR